MGTTDTTTTGGFDLASLNLAEQAETPHALTIVHPVSGAPLMGANGQPSRIMLIGAESNTARELQRRAQRTRAKSVVTKRIDPEEIEAMAAKFLASLVKGWENIEWQGQPLAFTHENALMLLTTLGWLRKQVDDFVYDVEAFASGN